MKIMNMKKQEDFQNFTLAKSGLSEIHFSASFNASSYLFDFA